MKRPITQTGKDEEGDIVRLCNPNYSRSWPPVSRAQAIRGIENKTHSYYVPWRSGETGIRVVTRKNGTKYLRTDRDSTNRNNLDDLPDC